MSSKLLFAFATLAAALVLTASPASLLAQRERVTPKFYPDDPVLVDDDAAFDASGARQLELSEYYDFLQNTFGTPGERTSIRAVNVNTLDEVPDSSWFTNRIGVRDPSTDELARGPNKVMRLDVDEWIVVRGKSPGGFHPGFQAVHPGEPNHTYQLEVDPPGYPQMATGAEVIGTLIYHAAGYNVVNVNATRIHPEKIRISEKATIRDVSGVRRFTRSDLDAVLRVAARDTAGRVYLSASRFEEGDDMGPFRYHGTRPDDPNDIYPHEHRRELRANRVFSAWLAHDDSRSINTLDMRVQANGRKHIRHYMYDFGATLGSATRFPDSAVSGYEYYVDTEPNLKSLGSLGLYVPPYAAARYSGRMPSSAGFFTSTAFEPERWRPNYPNAAFQNMRRDDAFWGARLVARFSDAMIRTVVAQVGYDDASAAEHIVRTLIERRDKIARVWLNGVNPVIGFALAADGTLTFSNAAEAAGVATPGGRYTLQWSRFDNESGQHTPIGQAVIVTDTRATAPQLPSDAAYASVSITAGHPEHPAWSDPVQVYFRREGSGWKTVGIVR
jgi:hypothetical protein